MDPFRFLLFCDPSSEIECGLSRIGSKKNCSGIGHHRDTGAYVGTYMHDYLFGWMDKAVKWSSMSCVVGRVKHGIRGILSDGMCV